MGEFCLADEFILETQGLTKEFAGFFAVRDVALKVRRGSIHALIGPNGAGKTTCFNLLTKFLRPSAGTIAYRGIDITAWRPAQVARLGLVRSFQISAVFPHLTVLENVRIALQRRRGRSFDFCRSARGQTLSQGDYQTVSQRPEVVQAYLGTAHARRASAAAQGDAGERRHARARDSRSARLVRRVARLARHEPRGPARRAGHAARPQ